MPVNLHDDVAVIAGGGSGIGAATAIRLAGDGARVVVADLSEQSATRTAGQISSKGGIALPVQVDISVEDSVRALFEAVGDRFGGVDALVNVGADTSADTYGVDDASDAITLPLAVWERTLAVNLTGYLLTIRAALPLMLARGGGAIVNISSEASVLGLPDKLAYSTAKAGINALTRHVARRWGQHGIRCNAVSPGLVLTETVKAMYGAEAGEDSRASGQNPSGRPGQPEEIAAAIAYLLSDDAAWVTGQVHHISGGLVLAN